MLSIDKIRELLPHRYPFLMVDRVVELEEGKRIVAIKNVTINEPFFQGHYPQEPIMPGVMIVEVMAQTGGLAVGGSVNQDVVPLLVSVDRMRFKQVVKPGDQLLITAEVTAQRSTLVKLGVKAEVDGNLAAQGELAFVLAKRGDA